MSLQLGMTITAHLATRDDPLEARANVYRFGGEVFVEALEVSADDGKTWVDPKDAGLHRDEVDRLDQLLADAFCEDEPYAEADRFFDARGDR